MGELGRFYLNPHASQFDGSALAGENCTPTAGANGADAVTGGLLHRTGGQVRSLVKRREETDPGTPGWSLPDLELAMDRLDLPFDNRTGQGWDGLRAARAARLYVVVQGDSDRFGNNTCSGSFNGPHCIGIHPAYSGSRWWIDDPICRTGRWEEELTIRAYAAKLAPTIRFGVFTHPVPLISTVPAWGPDVPADIIALDPPGRSVATAVRRTGHDYGSRVDMADLAAALRRARIDYGTVVNPADVRKLLKWRPR